MTTDCKAQRFSGQAKAEHAKMPGTALYIASSTFDCLKRIVSHVSAALTRWGRDIVTQNHGHSPHIIDSAGQSSSKESCFLGQQSMVFGAETLLVIGDIFKSSHGGWRHTQAQVEQGPR